MENSWKMCTVMVLPSCLKANDNELMLFACLATLLVLSSLSRVRVGKNSKKTDCNYKCIFSPSYNVIFFFSGQSQHVILVLSCKGGFGKSTVCHTDTMESIQRRKGKLKSLCSVDLWFTFLHLPALKMISSLYCAVSEPNVYKHYKRLTRRNVNRCYSLRITYFIFETF